MPVGHILETFVKIRKAKKLVGPLVGLVIGVLLETRPTFSPFEILHKFRECAQIAYFCCITKFTIYPEDDILYTDDILIFFLYQMAFLHDFRDFKVQKSALNCIAYFEPKSLENRAKKAIWYKKDQSRISIITH